MANSTSSHEPVSLDRFGRGRAFQLVIGIAIFGALLFGSAGRLDWIAGWMFLGLFSVFTLGLTIWALRRDPGLLNERGRAFSKEVPLREKLILAAITMLQITMFVASGLDAGRWRASLMPPLVQAAGWLLLIPAVSLATGAMMTNSYASAVSRIQQERGHHVVEGGPYRWVRHPMYLGILFYAFGVPLALGSYWALIPGGLLSLAFVARTAAEDRMLFRDLPGYAEYAERTRYRLIPGVW